MRCDQKFDVIRPFSERVCIAYSIHVFPCARVSGPGVTIYTVAFGIYTNLLKNSLRLVPIFFANRTTKETKNHFYGSQLVTNHFHDSHLYVGLFVILNIFMTRIFIPNHFNDLYHEDHWSVFGICDI